MIGAHLEVPACADLDALIRAMLQTCGGASEIELRLWLRALEPLHDQGCDIEWACGTWLREHSERPCPHDIAALAARSNCGRRSRDLISAVAAKHGVSLHEIFSATRGSDMVVAARHEVEAALRATGLSYPQIGRIVKRDPTSVMHGIKEHQKRVAAQAIGVRGGSDA